MSNPLAPLNPPYPPEIEAALQRYPRTRDGGLLSLFRVFANSHRFLAGKGALNLLDRDSPLTLRQRELIILRVTANLGCEYEWGVHVSIFARSASLTPAQIRATCCSGIDESCWSGTEQLLLQCIDQLCDHGRLEQQTLQRFRESWSLEQQLEILALCGNYHLISFVANSSELKPESSAPRFPDVRDIEN